MSTTTTTTTDAQTETDSAYARGQYFEEHDDPHVEGMVVIDHSTQSGIPHLRMAEKDTQTGVWRRYWVKEQFIVDEVNLNIATPTRVLDAETLAEVERKCDLADMRLSR